MHSLSRSHLIFSHSLNRDYYELCRLCGRTYGSENALKQHMRAKHEMGAQVYKCADCNRDFISQPALDIHTSASHKKRCTVLSRCLPFGYLISFLYSIPFPSFFRPVSAVQFATALSTLSMRCINTQTTNTRLAPTSA